MISQPQSHTGMTIEQDTPNVFLFIVGVISIFCLSFLIIILNGEPINREIAFGLYIKLLLFSLFLFLFLLIGADWFQRKYPLYSRGFFVGYVTLIAPLDFLLLALTVTQTFSLLQYQFSILFLHVSYPFFWFIGRNTVFQRPLLGRINQKVLYLMPILYATIFWVWAYHIYLRCQMEIAFVVCIMFFVFFMVISGILPPKRWALPSHWSLYCIVILFLIGIVYRPELPFDRRHFDFFLSPLNDVLQGKVLFVNSTSQYGVGVIYFLTGIFILFHIPVSYTGFSFIVNILFILQYILVGIMLYTSTKNKYFSLVGICIIIYFNNLMVYWPTMLNIPAQSPLRYGLIYLLLAIAWWNVNRNLRFLRILEYVLLGVTCLWSLETFLYTFLSLDAFYFIQEFLSAEQKRIGWIRYLQRLGLQAGVVLACWATGMVLSYFASGQWPNLIYYVDYFKVYTISESLGYSYELNFHDFWSGIVPAVYLLSVYFILFDRLRNRWIPKERSALIVGMSVAGLLEYSYYFVFDIDYHLALLCVPLIFICVQWISFIWESSRKNLPANIKWSLSMALVGSLLIGICIVPPYGALPKLSSTMIFGVPYRLLQGENIGIRNPYHVQPPMGTVQALVDLINKYAGGEKQIAIFADPEDETEALFRTKKTHILNISQPIMSSLSPAYEEFVITKAQQIAGQPEYIFYDSGENALTDFQQNVFSILTDETRYSIIEKRNKIYVLERQ